jgi:hypothetical protein
MLNQNKSIRHFLFMFVVTLCSCQKVIELDLNSASPAIVIEGSIYFSGDCNVSLSKTANFSSTNTFPPVTGASVEITDNLGHMKLLSELSPGKYTTHTDSSHFWGFPGRTYTLSVTAEGKTYQATSKLPAPVDIDSVLIINTSGFFGGPEANKKYIAVKYNDPGGIENYYRLVKIINGITISKIYIANDKYTDGQQQEEFLSDFNPDSDTDLQTGDTLTIELQCIDKNVYEYYRTFNEAGGGGPFGSPSPANPTSNFSNGALGYFSAYWVSSKTVIVQ